MKKYYFFLTVLILTSVGLTAQNTLLLEDFESGVPADWTTEAPVVSAWDVGNNLGSPGFPIPAHTSYAASNDNACGVCDLSEDIFITDTISFGTLSGITLDFDAFLPSPYSQISFPDSKGYIYVKPIIGGPWVLVYTVPIDASWQSYSVSLDAFVTGDMVIGFAHDDEGANATGFAIDNVHVYAQYDDDLALVSIDSPTTGCFDEVQSIVITVQNAGLNTLTGFTASYSVDGTSVPVETVSGLSLASGSTYQHIFATTATFQIGQAYQLNVLLGTDDDLNNNVFSSDIELKRYGTIDVPYTENFDNDESYYWSIQDNVGCAVQYNGGLVEMSGLTPPYANWVGNIGTTSESNAWNDNTEFHSSVVVTCNSNQIPANTENLELLLDLRQETQLSLVYSWFAVYVNGNRVNDVNGNDSFNPATPSGDAWTTLTYNLSSFNNGSPIEIELRGCTHREEDKVYVDNVIIRQRNEADAGVINIISPISECGLTGTNDLTIIVENFGVDPISNIPVFYELDNNGSVLAGLVNSTIQPGSQSAPYTFSGLTMQDLDLVGSHTLRVYTQLTGDIYHPENDELSMTIVNLPLVTTFPYEQDFEGQNYWSAGGTNSSWEVGVPSGTVITPNVSGQTSWVTSLGSSYNHNESSYIQGPCFDFSSLTDPFIEFDIWYHTDGNTDGAQVQVSVNGGAWETVGQIVIPAPGDPIPWYNNAVSALGANEVGFTDNSNGWTTVTYSLTSYVGQSQLSFRVLFASDGNNLGGNPATEQYYEGIAIDNMYIGEPTANWDLKAVEWITPATGYTLTSTEPVSFKVENLGLNTVTTFNASYSINGGVNFTTAETFTVSIVQGGMQTLTFQNSSADLSAWGVYNCVVAVELLNDENTTNDEATSVVESVPIISVYPYYEDFQSSNHFWENGGSNVSWEYGIAAGLTIPIDNDEVNDLSWVTNLDGSYNSNEQSWVESPIFDFTNIFQPAIEMRIAYDAEGNTADGANLQYSVAGGAWTTVGTVAPVGNPDNWYVNNIDALNGEAGWTTYSGGWVSATHDLSMLGQMANVKLRVLFGSDASDEFEGMAFDNIHIFEAAPHDLALTGWTSQTIGCGLTSSELITVTIENLGFFAESAFSVNYSIDLNGTIVNVSENIAGPLLPAATLLYTFVAPFDFSASGVYECTAQVVVVDDSDNGNDSFSKQIVSSPSITGFPYIQDFEAGSANWLIRGNTSFELGIPDAGNGVINTAASGSSAFVTNLDGEYSNNEAGWVESPCFNFALMDTPAIQFSYIAEIEYYPAIPGFAFDGAYLEYSTDGGQAWIKVGAVGDTVNWYNFDNIWQVGHGWSGIVSNWTTTGIRMPYLGGESNVKFRFFFQSDVNNTYLTEPEGFGFDNILIYNDVNFAGDAGISAITIDNDCEFTNDHYVTVQIKNYHPDSTMYAGEVVNVAYTFNGAPAVTETLILGNDILPGAEYTYQFTVPVNYGAFGTFTIEAYTLTVNDLDPLNDSWSESVDVFQTPAIGTETITNVLCYGQLTGMIDLPTVSGYSYEWSDFSTMEDLSNVGFGTYTVTVTDQNNCTNSANYSITEPTELTLSLAVTHNVCYEDATAEIVATVSGGTTGYTYDWGAAGSTSTISSLASGSYTLLVTDNNSCTVDASETVNPEGPFEASIVITNQVTCTNSTDGELTVNVTGGASPFTYDWNDIPDNFSSRSNLGAGTYEVSVEDANGCFAGGVVQPVTYTWATEITPYQHTVAILNTLNFMIDGSVVTIGPGDEYLLGVFYNDNNTLVCGGYAQYDGNVTMMTAWGEAPPIGGFYQGNPGEEFVWKIRANGVTIDADLVTYGALAPPNITAQGNFTNNGLSVITYLEGTTTAPSGNTVSATLVNPSPLSLSFNLTNHNGFEISCNGLSDGGVVAEATGGMAPYSYQWAGGPSSQSYQLLSANTYTVDVVDAHGCTVGGTVTLTEPAQLTLSFTKTDVSCNGLNDGLASAVVGGGVSPYVYNWADVGVFGADRVVLFADTYTVTITDANNCTVSGSVVITEPYAIPLTEDFEGGTLPTDWTLMTNASSVGWEFGTNLNGTSPFSTFNIPAHTGYAADNDDAHDDLIGSLNFADDYLVSPVFDLTGFASVNLQFDAFFSDNQIGAATVEVRVDGGPWMPLYSMSPDAAWQDGLIVSLDNYIGNCQVQLGFHYFDGNQWASGFAIDNVNIDGALQYAHDLAIVSWVEPASYSCMLGNSETVMIEITNIGLNSASGFELAYTMNGVTISAETYTGTLAVGVTEIYTFTTVADMSALGTYSFGADINYTADGDPANNSISGITVTHYPHISSFEYLEDFESTIDDFTTISGSETGSGTMLVGGSNVLFAQGGNPSVGWVGGSNPTESQVWNDNASHVVSFETYCPVDATGLGSLELLFDLQQAFANSLENNWFRVLVTGTSGTDVVYQSNPSAQGSPMTEIVIDLDAYAGQTFSLAFQFSNRSAGDITYVDNILLREKLVDVAAVSIISPTANCQLSASETITVEFENLGGLPISNFDVAVTVDAIVLTETVTATINPGTTVQYTFTTITADLSALGNHAMTVDVNATNDANTSNDLIAATFFTTPYYNTYPFMESAANFGMYWLADGTNSSWEFDVDTWYTGLAGDYNNNEVSFVTSPCFDFTSLVNPVVEFSLNYTTEFNSDGLVLQYSNNGSTWTTVGAPGDIENWYNGPNSWTGTSGGTLTVRHSLSGITGDVQFRLYFTGDNSNTADGIEFSNFAIFEMPDASVVATSPLEVCAESGFSVSVDVQNSSAAVIPTGTAVDVQYVLNGAAAVMQTFFLASDLAVNAIATFDFSPTIEVFNLGGTYSLVATATIAGDLNSSNNEYTGSVQVNALPLVDAGADQTICDGDGPVTLTATGAATYDWGALGSGASVVVTVATTETYYVTGTDNNNCSSTDDVTVFVNSLPTADAGLNQTVCYNESVTLTATGGSSYEWSTGDLTAATTFIVTTNDTYTVSVTDSNGCTDTDNVDVNFIALPTTTITDNVSICFGEATTLVATGGDVYNWNTGLQTASITVAPNQTTTYYVTITDNTTTCSKVEDVEVAVTNGPQASETIVHNNCYAGTSGSISLNVTSTGLTTIVWSGNLGTSASITGLSAGFYTVTITDETGVQCAFIHTYEVTEPLVPMSAIILDVGNNVGYSISCNGIGDGELLTVVTSGTPSYSYSWSSNALGATSPSLTGLGPDTYTVSVVDNYGCTASASYTVTEPPVLSGTLGATDITCFGMPVPDGTVSLVPAGGTPGYTYLWSNNSTDQNLVNVPEDTYTVTITDANGCFWSSSIFVDEPDQLVANEVISDYNGYQISCFGSSDGSFTVNPTGGIPPYTYLWNTQATGNSITGISDYIAYTVTITDSNGCTVVASQQMTYPQPITISGVVANDISCFGLTNGSITINQIYNGVPPFTFAWSDGGTYSSTSQNLTGLSEGTYTVVVTDANNCTATTSAEIIEPAQITVVAEISSMAQFGGAHVSCPGASDGELTAVVNGGTNPFQFVWSDENSTASMIIGSLAAGTYTVTVTDGSGCTATGSVTIVDPSAVSATAEITSDYTGYGASCFNSTDGSAVIHASMGTSPYTYNWGSGFVSDSTGSGLSAGFNNVTVHDFNGCEFIVNFEVTAPLQMVVVTHITADVSCIGQDDAAMEVVVTEGVPPYTYLWSDGLGTGTSVTGIGAGTYTVQVVDANNCVAVGTVNIVDPDAVTVSIQINSDYSGYPVSCYGAETGSLIAVATGGTANYTYLWSGLTATTMQVDNLAAGAYGVTATDDNGCWDNEFIIISSPDELNDVSTVISDYSGFNVTCNGVNDGWIDVVPGGGVAPYTHSWSNDSITSFISMLSPGTYSDTVTDANGCVMVFTYTLTEPDAMYGDFTSSDYNGYNISCLGGNDGWFTMNVINGTAPYTYLWSNDSITSGQSMLTADTYLVTITDVIGCIVYDQIVLDEPPLFTVDQVTQTVTYQSLYGVSCYGMTDGAADVTVTNGISPFTYLWSNSSTLQNPADLPGGLSSVTVTDANGCEATGSINLLEPDSVQGIIDITSQQLFNGSDVSCNGSADGMVTLSMLTGHSPYTYFWSNQETTESLSGLAAGTYTVTITDAHGCVGVETVTLVEPDALSYTVAQTDVDCYGNANGVLDVTVSGGTGNYSYFWSNGSGMEDATNLAPGYYYFLVLDANWCYSVSGVYQITEPDGMLASAMVTSEAAFDGYGVSCNGASDGTVDLVVGGGVAPYSYSWSNGASTEDLTGLAAGPYDVVVTDANGCTATVNVVVSEPALFSVVANELMPVSCNGLADGSAEAVTTNGFTPFVYSWSNNATTANITDVAGTYTVTVTDAHGCTANASVIITESITLSVTLASITPYNGFNVSCFDAIDGTISTTVVGGVGNYTYAWSNSESTADITNAAVGNNSVTVTDDNGCSASASIVLTSTTAFSAVGSVTSDYSGSHISCTGATNGSVEVVASGGLTPYAYLWDYQSSTTSSLTNVGAGDYPVLVSDANGCTYNVTVTVVDPGGVEVSIQSQNITCNGANDGFIIATATGGTSPYFYFWNTGQTTSTIDNLGEGTYYLFVVDANSCFSTMVPVTITEPTGTNIAISGGWTNVSCFGLTDGSINVTPNFGNPPYDFIWEDAQGTLVATTEDLTNIGAGSYFYTVTDAFACHTASGSYNVTQPSLLVVDDTVSTYAGGYGVSCFGAQDGEITISISGGTLPYAIHWDVDGVTTLPTVSNLIPGTYAVTVTDANNCQVLTSYLITEPAELMASDSVITDILCYGDATGMVDITVTGGVTPYVYSWTGGSSNEDLSNVTAGTYDVLITDANGCTYTKGFTVSESPEFMGGEVIVDVSCFGADDGSITLNPTGGVGPYSYAWSNQATTMNIVGLNGDSYIVTVTDANGCPYVLTYQVNEPDLLVLSTNVSDVSCNLAGDGAIDLSIAGGTAPYGVAWSNSMFTEDISGLDGGPYTVDVTDANGCTSQLVVNVYEPDAIVITPTISEVSCNGDSDGEIALSVTGGVTPYYYSWSNGSLQNTVTGLPGGTYTVDVTSIHNNVACMESATFTLVNPDPLTFTNVVDEITCNGGNDGAINLTVSGGTQPYTFLWNTSATTEDLSGLSAGNYTVEISDAHGCEISNNLTLPWNYTINPTSHTMFVQSTPTINGVSIENGDYIGVFYYDSTAMGLASGGYLEWTSGGANVFSAFGTETVFPLDGSPPIYYNNGFEANEVVYWKVWRAADGSVVDMTATYTVGGGNFQVNGVSILSGLAATGAPAIVPVGAGNWTLTEPDALEVLATVTPATCYMGADGIVDISVNNAFAPVSYMWSNGETTEDITGLTADTYTVLVTDGNGCNLTQSFVVTEPDELIVSYTANDVSCYGANDGSIDVTVTGGNSVYSYDWLYNPSISFGWDYTNTGTNHTIIVSGSTLVTLNGSPIQVGDVVGLFYDSLGSMVCAGYTIWDGNNTSIAAWGAEVDLVSGLSQNNGFAIGEEFTWMIWQSSTGLTYSADATYAAGFPNAQYYITDGMSSLTSVTGTVLFAPYNVTTEDLSNIDAGSYQLVVTDGNGCETTLVIDITEPEELVVSFTMSDFSGFNVSDCGATDGWVGLSVSGGQSPYSYAWSDGGTNASATGLGMGPINVTVTDDSGCIKYLEFNLTELCDPVIVDCLPTDVTCLGINDGAVDLVVSGGFTPYTYSWDTGATTQDLSALGAGTYAVTVTDALGQTASCSSVVNEGSQIQVSFDIIHNSCFGTAAGSVNLTVGGGTAPYTYVWTNSESTSFIENLPAGFYGCLIIDANGCTTSFNIQIFDGTPIDLTGIVTDASVYGAADGSVVATATGGNGGFTYSWSNGATTALNDGLIAGSYTVVATDAAGCEAQATFIVGQPDPVLTLQITSLTSTPVSCFGANDGNVNLEVAFGNPPYTYTWSNGASTQDLNGVGGGLYLLTVSDGTTTLTADIYVDEAAAALAYSTVVTNATSCQTDGSIMLTVTGGAQPYTYLWNTGATTQNLVNIEGGNYTVTVTDAYGCVMESSTITVTADLMSITMFTTHNACFGDATGSALAIVTGGVLPYTFIWSNGATVEYIDNLTAGTYTVTVTDGNGCQFEGQAVITQPDEIIVQIIPNPIGLTASVVSGAIGQVTYLWNNNKPFQSIKGLTVGNTYCVTVTDENGCTGTACAIYTGIFNPSKVSDPFSFGLAPKTDTELTLDKVADIVIYPNPTTDGKFTVDLTSISYENAVVEIIDGYGKLVHQVKVDNEDAGVVFIELSNASAGLYYIRAIYDSNNVITKRLIIAE